MTQYENNIIKEILKSRQLFKISFRSQNWTYWEIQTRNSDTLAKTVKSPPVVHPPQLTVPERNYEKNNNTWNIRRLVNESFVPATQRTSQIGQRFLKLLRLF